MNNRVDGETSAAAATAPADHAASAAADEHARDYATDPDRKSTRLNSSHYSRSRMPSSA